MMLHRSRQPISSSKQVLAFRLRLSTSRELFTIPLVDQIVVMKSMVSFFLPMTGKPLYCNDIPAQDQTMCTTRPKISICTLASRKNAERVCYTTIALKLDPRYGEKQREKERDGFPVSYSMCNALPPGCRSASSTCCICISHRFLETEGRQIQKHCSDEKRSRHEANQ